MIDVYIGIGSNLGNKEKNIKNAIEILKGECRILKVSSLSKTEPVGYKNQDWFLNCAVKIETKLNPKQLLQFIRSIEKKLKRVRTIKNGPRTIDLDILFYGNKIIKTKNLIVPHPRVHKRMFVLEPLKEICPNFVHPVLRKSIKELYFENYKREYKMKRNLKFYLKNKLSEKELQSVPSSFDVVGDIMIFSEFPKELAKKEKIVGQAILDNYKNIKTILKKTKKYSGRFRTPKLRVIRGKRKKETICRENNIFIKLNVEKVYFSPRMSSERKRIADLVKPNESVLVMFSGSGVYPLVIAKNTSCKEVYGIEINPIAHKYALENIKKNKLEYKIKIFLGDVKKILPKLKKKFSRIIMPLPKGGENFLELALRYAKNNGYVHFYDFLHENEFYKAEEKIKKICKKAKRRCRIISIVKCGKYSPGFYRVCVDFKLKV